MAVSEELIRECRKCGRNNLKIFEDGSGHCLDCDDSFADIKEYSQLPKYNLNANLNVPTSEQVLFQPHIEQPLSPQPQIKPIQYKKIAAISIVIIIVITSVGFIYVNSQFNPIIIIDTDDLNFYGNYPSVPSEFIYLRMQGETLYGEFNLFIDNSDLQSVQVSPTIEALAEQFVDKYPDELKCVEATYKFVAEEIEYTETNGYQYPVTTLQLRSGSCADYASLLASLLYAEGFNDVALVLTNTTTVPHVYVAVKLPYDTSASNTIETSIRDKIGNRWIAMDPTNGLDGYYLPFRYLDSSDDGHYNIQTIVKVPVFGCVFDIEYQSVDDPQLGYCWDIQCELYAFEHNGDDDVTFTFQMYENDVLYSSYAIDVVSQDSLSLTSYDFYLDYNDYYAEEDTWYICITITP